jgi:phospholipase A1
LKYKLGKITTLAFLILFPGSVAQAMPETVSQCLLTRLENAEDDVTVGQLRSACEEKLAAASDELVTPPDSPRGSVVDIRREEDFDTRARQFAISTNRANYFIYTYNGDPNEDPYQVEPTDFLDKGETKFQVSFKMPVATELFGGNTDLLFAFTSVAWWQMLNDEIYNPFRETNYEPEIFFQNYSTFNVFGLDFINWELGLNHQSNGQSIPQSRGWDRAIASTSIELTDDLVVGLRAWYVLDSQEKNNPDIEDYMGHGDIGLGWVPNRNTFTLMYRPASRGGAMQATWSYPISKYLRLYAQYWNGYGESLIDYNVRTKRFGLGIALSEIIARN